MTARVNPEVLWELIIPYTQNPIPAPLSRPPRSTIRQDSLASLCRVSRLFNSIASKLLYTHLITDNLPQFLHLLHSPSKRRKLALVRSLRIEYSEKGVEPSYEAIFREDNVWRKFGRSKAKVDAAIVVQCEKEVEALIRCLEFARDERMPGRIFARMETIAIAPTYGKEDDRWRRYDTKHNHDHTVAPPSNDCGARFDQFLHGLNLRHLCVRDPNGPLSLPLITYASTLPPIRYSRTIHFDADIDELYIPFGSPVRYVSDAPQSSEWQASCEAELAKLTKALKPVVKRGGIKEILPNLETAAVSSIYGRIPHWEIYELTHQAQNTQSQSHMSLAVFDWFLSSGNLRQLCVRDPNGPLGILALSRATDSFAQPTSHFPRVFHLPKADDITRIPLRLGSTVRWVSDSAPTEDWASILVHILGNVIDICDGRDHHQEREFHPDTVDLHIYSSTARFTTETYFTALDDLDTQDVDFGLPFSKFGTFDETCHTLSEEEQRGMTRLLGALLEKFFRQRSGLADKVRWSPSSAIPVCASCGSGVPE